MFNFKAEEPKGEGCCSVQPKGKQSCPTCGEKAKGVLSKTLDALLTNEAKQERSCLEGYSFCKTASCEVVYFKEDAILTQKDIKVVVGHKEGATPATVCYCFDWTKEKIKAELIEKGESTATADITHKMDTQGCSCETMNPSGGCCLGDISKTIKELKGKLNV